MKSMFYHLQYIHLFRPFLKYRPSASPLPPHVSPRRICTANAGFISKLMRLYKKLYNLRQICNIAVYMLHSACTIHLLNLPEKTARRDIIHGVKHLEEIAEDWLCARRTLSIISVLARKWNCELPEEAAGVLRRTDEKWGSLVTTDVPSPSRVMPAQFTPSPPAFPQSPAQPQRAAQSGSRNNLDQQLATNMAQDVPSAMQTAFLSGLGSVPTGSAQPIELPTSSAPQKPPLDKAFAPENSWVMTGMSQPTMPRFYQTYAPVQQHQQQPPPPPASSGPSAGSSRQRTPTTQYALDGKDWYLNDGVSWQQNFEGWALGASPSPGSNNGGGGGSGVEGESMAGVDMFMFKGLQGSGLGLGDVWDFDSSMTNLDMLPGLD